MADLDLVDMMGGARLPAAPSRAMTPVITKAANDTDEMSMSDFVQWTNNVFGSMTLTQALQQVAFLLCCDVIAQDMAKATLQLREHLKDGTTRIVHPEEHPVAAMLAIEPNERHTWIEFVEMMGLWGCYTSNAYAVIFRDRFGEPQRLVPLQTMRALPLVEGRDVFYQVTAGSMAEQALLGAASMRVPERDMIHVRARMTDGIEGLSTMTVGKETFETGKAIDEYRERLFSEDGQTRGVFWRDNMDPLPELAFQRLRMQFRELMSRFSKVMEPIVLEGGLKFQAISSNPDEMELTKQFEAQINATCRLLRVPPHKVFHLSNEKYSNLETQEKMYLGDTLVPVVSRYEQRYAKVLLSRKDRMRFLFQHNREEMVLKDTKLETEKWTAALARGACTFDEYRAGLFGQNPLPNGQGKMRMIPVNMNVVDESGAVVIGGTAGGDDKESQPEPGSGGSGENKPKDAGDNVVRLVAN